MAGLSCLVVILVSVVAVTDSSIINLHPEREDFCAHLPCGEGNTCFNTPTGYKCFCRPGDDSFPCTQEEKCMLYNHTGVCRASCLPEETGFIIQHLGDKFMDLKIYNSDGNVTVRQGVPVVDMQEQDPCMWQLTGNPNCCVPTDDMKIGCFAYGSYVVLESGETVPVESLRTGDKVLSLSTETGKPIFSDVVMIMHQEPERTEEMIAITTSSSKMTLTHDHLVYLRPVGQSAWKYVFSELAQVGDEVTVYGNGETRVELVEDVVKVKKTGLYAPVTIAGTIIVDGITASCYGNHPDHWLAHMVFAPIRFLYAWMPWMYNGDAVTADGSHPYVAFMNVHLRRLTGKSLDMSQHRLDKLTAFQ